MRDHTMKTFLHLLRQAQLTMILLIISATPAPSQDLTVGSWRHHLPNNRLLAVVETPSHVIGATPYGLIQFNKADNSVQEINKVHGLTGFGISAIAWSDEHEALIIGYENGNLDVITGGRYYNIPDITQSAILGSKKINNIRTHHGLTLLACDFGIVKLDLGELLIRDTWFIGPFGSMVEVNDVLITDQHFWAATNAGLFSILSASPNPADYRQWTREDVGNSPNEPFHLLAWHAGKVFTGSKRADSDRVYMSDGATWQQFPAYSHNNLQLRNIHADHGHLLVATNNGIDIFDNELELVRQVSLYHSHAVTANDMVMTATQKLWVADHHQGLVWEKETGLFERIILPGPPNSNAFGLAASNGQIWVAPGSVTYGGENFWNQNGFYLFDGRAWRAFDRFQFPELEPVADIIRISTDPQNPNKAYAASWLGGMLELSPEGVVARYDESNSTLRRRAGIGDRLRVGGTAVDNQGNVWVTNSESDNPLSVKKTNGDWIAFSGKGATGPQTVVGDIIIDHSNQKWLILPFNGILLLKNHGLETSSDYETRRLTTLNSQGNLPNNNVHSLAVDHSGYVWVGTEAGVAVFYGPGRAFTGGDFFAHRIIVTQADGFSGYLLETETVSSIAVDGSNKKWFGTTRSGAFLLSADGRETIFHFNKDNSPLPSNNILDIAINDQTGEVFFATDMGLVSFRGFATGGGRKHEDVYAYPNPVRPGYDGYISVKGLVRNASVRITDINGNLIWATTAEGGQAIWNGQDLHGRRPATGVYLVFSTNEDGEETAVTKILFVN